MVYIIEYRSITNINIKICMFNETIVPHQQQNSKNKSAYMYFFFITSTHKFCLQKKSRKARGLLALAKFTSTFPSATTWTCTASLLSTHTLMQVKHACESLHSYAHTLSRTSTQITVSVQYIFKNSMRRRWDFGPFVSAGDQMSIRILRVRKPVLWSSSTVVELCKCGIRIKW